MDPVTEVQEPDEARPLKRVRLEAPLEVTEEVQEEVIDDGDWNDIYGDAPTPPVKADAEQTALIEKEEEQNKPQAEQEVDGGVPVEAIDDGEELVAQDQHLASTDEPSTQVLDETTEIDVGEPHTHADAEQSKAAGDEGAEKSKEADEVDEVKTNGEAAESTTEPKNDLEFLAAAAAQKDNQAAEWQFDSSDAASSSDSDSDSSSDDSSEDGESGSEGGYEMLDPATAAKILMSGDGDDEGKEGKNSGTHHQPRTANEVAEEVVPKPDVVVTEDMKITYLGIVERVVENLLLIKAETPGEYQVLESGSVLCNEQREVFGAVAETFGRVQEPMYSVAFTNEKEIEDAGLKVGTKIFYVDNHSTFVFTQPLKNMKGTDASNIHDEEVGEDELEFSDDEKEAEYKRLKKAAKRVGRGGLTRSAFNEERATRSFGAPGHDSGRTFVNGSDAPQQQYGGGMSYDEGDVQEEFYSPLKRPENLSQMMAGGIAPPRPQAGQFDRGRGRGRGFDRGRGRGDRGRGDRGRGRGGFDQRQRGGRGNFTQDAGSRGGFNQQNSHRGNAHSFPDRHNSDGMGAAQNSLPPNPNVQQPPLPPQQQQTQQQYPAYPQYQPQASTQQSYQFNGYTFQYGNPPPYPASAPANPAGPMPAGAYVNPAFFQNQQQSQNQWPQPPQQQQTGYPAWTGQQQQQQPAQQYQYGQPGAAAQPQMPGNLAEILRQFGGQQQQ